MTRPNSVLGVPLMDEDHARLEALFDRTAETPDAGLPALLAEVEAETRAHFAREETLMQSAGVPVFHCHAAQHRLLLAEFARPYDAVSRGDMESLRRFLGDTLPEMIAAHVNSVDHVTASFLNGETSEQDWSGLRLPQGG